MDKLTNWVEQAVVPKVSRITSLRYFQALRNGFFAIMPLTIIGSIFMLITDFPVAGYGDFMAGIFGAGWADMISPAYRATFNMMGIIFAGTMSYKLAESYEMDRLTSLILGIVAYVVVLPKTVTTESGEVVTKVLSFDWLGTQGVITAIIMSILSVELTRFCIKKKLVIKMPGSVPSMVSQAFSALIPGIFVVAVDWAFVCGFLPAINLCGDSSATARFNRNPFCNYYCGWLKWTVLVVRDSSNCHQFHAISYFICECRQKPKLSGIRTINCSKWQLWHGPNARSICHNWRRWLYDWLGYCNGHRRTFI